MSEQQEKEIRTVCGGVLKESDKYPSANYKGEVVFFCTHSCLKAFEKDPDRFIAGEIEHPLD